MDKNNKKGKRIMKKHFMILAAMLCCIGLMTTLTACDSDDDDVNNQPTSTSLTSVKSVLSTEVSQAVLDLCDVEVKYIDSTNCVKTDTMTATSWSKEVSNSKFNVTTGLCMSFKRKAGAVVDTTATYKVTTNGAYRIKLVQGETIVNTQGSALNESFTVKGTKMDAYLDGLCASNQQLFAKSVTKDGTVTDTTINWEQN